MGTFIRSLHLNQHLLCCANNSITGVMAGGCRKTECNIEHNLRQDLSQNGAQVLYDTKGKKKKCCKRIESLPFTPCCQEYKGNKWSPCNTNTKWHNDIYYDGPQSNCQTIVEIKFVDKITKTAYTKYNICSPNNYNRFLLNNSACIDDTTHGYYHFNCPNPSIKKAVDYHSNGSIVYYSYLNIQGALWLDIVRLKTAAAQFASNGIKIELYMLVIANQQVLHHKLTDCLDAFSNSYQWLYHDLGKSPNKRIFRSPTTNFHYNYTALTPANGLSGYLIRIEPQHDT